MSDIGDRDIFGLGGGSAEADRHGRGVAFAIARHSLRKGLLLAAAGRSANRARQGLWQGIRKAIATWHEPSAAKAAADTVSPNSVERHDGIRARQRAGIASSGADECRIVNSPREFRRD
jgi:hypothetical protein